MHHLVDNLGWALVHSLWQGTAIYLALRLILAALARSSANVRYLVACGALAMATFAFWFTFARLMRTTEPVAVTGDVGSVLVSHPSPDSLAGHVGEGPASFHFAMTSILPWVVAIWITGCAVGTVRLSLGWRAAMRIARGSRRALPPVLERRCCELASTLGLRRVIALGESTLVDAPSIIGWLKPVILIPAGVFAGLTPAQVDAILAHELAHLARRDYLINLLQSACEILFFYHPSIRAIGQTIRLEREQACDDIAVALTGDPRGYAAALAKLEAARTPSLVLAATGGNAFLARVRRLLGMSVPPAQLAPATPWLVAATVVVVAGLSFTPGVAVHTVQAQVNPVATRAPVLATTIQRREAEFPFVIAFRTDQPGWGKFSTGDDITITSVRGDRAHIEPGGRYLVEGEYSLSSMPEARLGLSLTVSSRDSSGAISRIEPEEWTQITAGSGKFALRKSMGYRGYMHVSFSMLHGGRSRGTIYFREPGVPRISEPPPELTVTPILADDPVIRQLNERLVETRAAREKLALRYAAKHPKMIEATNEVAYAEQELQRASDRLQQTDPAKGDAPNDAIKEYVLQPADLIRVQVFQEDDLGREVRLSEASTVTLPLIGKVDLRDRTVRQAEDMIRQLYDNGFLVKSRVNLNVLEERK